MDEIQLLTSEEVAEMYRVIPDTVILWAKRSNHPLPSIRAGRRYLFDPQKVKEWVARGGIANLGDENDRLRASA
ncbi:MAG: helix-turn-helix domain-containing protein [Ktedonobacterales bacterium]